jgi:hypothetical protein
VDPIGVPCSDYPVLALHRLDRRLGLPLEVRIQTGRCLIKHWGVGALQQCTDQRHPLMLAAHHFDAIIANYDLYPFERFSSTFSAARTHSKWL